ncbi:hypothetical protein SGCOL_010405 [Colletotrichum sp. CLE4]
MLHIHNGFNILAPLRPNSGATPETGPRPPCNDLKVIEDQIFPMFSRLGILSCLAGRFTPPVYLHIVEDDAPHKDFEDARRRIFATADTCIRFISSVTPKADTLLVGIDDLVEQAKLQTRLEAWRTQFDDLLKRLQAAGNPANPDAVNILLVNYKVVYIWTRVCTTSQETDTDVYRSDFDELVTYAEQVIKPGKEKAAPQLLSFDVQLLAPLFYAALKCRHSSIRRRALELLRLAPRREGLWNAHHAYLTAKRIIELEEQFLGEDGALPDEASRLFGLPLPDDQSRVYNLCELPFDFRVFDHSVVASPTCPGTLEAKFQTRPMGLFGEFQGFTEYIKL